MNPDTIIARALHVLAVVTWIGGVSFVTTVLLPAIRKTHPPAERLAVFLGFENAFAVQARLSVALAGASGVYLLWRFNLWDRFTQVHFWWMHAMVIVWLIFAALLFVIEPLVMHRRLAAQAATDEAATAFARVERMHRILLALSLVTVLAAMAGAHGLF